MTGRRWRVEYVDPTPNRRRFIYPIVPPSTDNERTHMHRTSSV